MEKDVWVCDRCGKEFDSRRALLGHKNLQCEARNQKERGKMGELFLSENTESASMVMEIGGIEIPVEGSFKVEKGETYVELETEF